MSQKRLRTTGLSCAYVRILFPCVCEHELALWRSIERGNKQQLPGNELTTDIRTDNSTFPFQISLFIVRITSINTPLTSCKRRPADLSPWSLCRHPLIQCQGRVPCAPTSPQCRRRTGSICSRGERPCAWGVTTGARTTDPACPGPRFGPSRRPRSTRCKSNTGVACRRTTVPCASSTPREEGGTEPLPPNRRDRSGADARNGPRTPIRTSRPAGAARDARRRAAAIRNANGLRGPRVPGRASSGRKGRNRGARRRPKRRRCWPTPVPSSRATHPSTARRKRDAPPPNAASTRKRRRAIYGVPRARVRSATQRHRLSLHPRLWRTQPVTHSLGDSSEKAGLGVTGRRLQARIRGGHLKGGQQNNF